MCDSTSTPRALQAGCLLLSVDSLPPSPPQKSQKIGKTRGDACNQPLLGWSLDQSGPWPDRGPLCVSSQILQQTDVVVVVVVVCSPARNVPKTGLSDEPRPGPQQRVPRPRRRPHAPPSRLHVPVAVTRRYHTRRQLSSSIALTSLACQPIASCGRVSACTRRQRRTLNGVADVAGRGVTCAHQERHEQGHSSLLVMSSYPRSGCLLQAAYSSHGSSQSARMPWTALAPRIRLY